MVKDEFKKILLEEGTENLSQFEELSFDNLLEDGYIKDIPVVRSFFIKIGKTLSTTLHYPNLL